MYEELVKRLRDAAKMSEALAVLLPHSEGNATAKLYKEAADAIEELSKRVPKSGVWREEDGGYDDVYYECSVCGAGICTIEGDPVNNAWSYCPECGAKMTGIERLPQPPEEE